VAEDVFDDGLEVGLLAAALGEVARVERVGVDDLEEEAAGTLVALGLVPAVANRGERAADETGDNLVDEGEAASGGSDLPSRASCWTRPMATTEVAQSMTIG
jgi:hypothetical protein